MPYDLRTKKTEEVAAARELEARDQFLCHSSAADEVPALKNSDGKASTSQVSGGDQAVMATADDDCVPFLILLQSCG